VWVGAALLVLAVGTGAALLMIAASEGTVFIECAGWGIELLVSSVLLFE